MIEVKNKSKKRLSSTVKFAIGFILATLIMKFILGNDAAVLVNILSKEKVIHADALLQAVILLIQTLISLPLCLGFGVLLVEFFDEVISRRNKGISK
ncbi:hypothetical protein L3V79_09215 [Thiotrichales bacterium 19S9-12]|nr:hypothetical protein [Thiotrichales bacterium 19S9-11]MCF6812537.1 hypothetical protein [Thiotrichales bacterium 19S9-12]